MVKVSLKLDGLNKVYEALDSTHVLRVGILGDKASVNHEGSDLTNAEIGAIQETGTIFFENAARKTFAERIKQEQCSQKL